MADVIYIHIERNRRTSRKRVTLNYEWIFDGPIMLGPVSAKATLLKSLKAGRYPSLFLAATIMDG